jgi:predicted nucleic acid-binding protein
VSFVVDSSVALSWCFNDEHTDATNRLLHEVAQRGAVVPAVWPLEVLNGLAMGERRGRLDAAQRKTITGFLRDLPIRVDDATAEQAWGATSALAARHRLTVYDAAYLELAHRLALPLATLDQELRTAAVALGVALLGANSDPIDF